jgi:phage terminase small subunit
LQVPEGEDPLKFLLSVMNDPKAAAALRVRAAVAAVQYTHAKRGEGGKKDDRQAAAEKAARGRFSAGKPPRLVVNNG